MRSACAPRRGQPVSVLLLAVLLAGCAGSTGPGAQPPSTSAAVTGASSPTASTSAAGPTTGDVQPVPAPVGPAPAVDPGSVPVELDIPAIGVDVPLIGLGTTAAGELEVPSDYQQVGWFTGGAAPGQTGPAVIAGHVDSTDGPAPFYRLRDLAAGDEVLVRSADGTQHTFRVDGVQQYPKDQFPSAAVYGPAPGPVLRLITCGGTFDRASRHYRDNVVVFAS